MPLLLDLPSRSRGGQELINKRKKQLRAAGRQVARGGVRSSVLSSGSVSAAQYPRMRHVADIPHPTVKITLLAWNGKFLLKLEQGNLEQTYKVAELDLTTGTDAEVRELLDAEFLAVAITRFAAMRTDLQAAFDRHELR